MAAQTIPQSPLEAVISWLLNQWHGELRPLDVSVETREDVDGREAFYFVVVLPEPTDETWDTSALFELERGLRDKALDVGLRYPWYLVPRAPHDDLPEDEEDLQDEED